MPEIAAETAFSPTNLFSHFSLRFGFNSSSNGSNPKSPDTSAAALSGSSEGHATSESDASDAEDAQSDVDELLYQAQTALIQHAYPAALKHFKRAAALGSSDACLSLGHLFIEGLHAPAEAQQPNGGYNTHRSQHRHNQGCISADFEKAAKYYIDGIEIEASTVSAKQTLLADSDEGIGGMNEHDYLSSSSSSASLSSYKSPTTDNELLRRDLNLETLSDLCTALASLYRIGKIMPISQRSSFPHESVHASAGKGKEEDLYDRGAKVAQRMLHHTAFRPLRNSIRSKPPSPAMQEQSLDSREMLTRGIFVSLSYLVALTCYPSTHIPGKLPDYTDCLRYWERTIAVSRLPGGVGSSKTSLDLVDKAKYRVEMIRLAQEREEEVRKLIDQGHAHPLWHVSHKPKLAGIDTAIHSKKHYQPFLSPSEMLDNPLVSPKLSPLVASMKMDRPKMSSNSRRTTYSNSPTNSRPVSRKASAPAVPTLKQLAEPSPPRKEKTNAKFTLGGDEGSRSASSSPPRKSYTKAVDASTMSQHLAKAQLAPDSPSGVAKPRIASAASRTGAMSLRSSIYSTRSSILSTMSLPRLSRLRESSVLAPTLSQDHIGVPASSLRSRGSTVSLASTVTTTASPTVGYNSSFSSLDLSNLPHEPSFREQILKKQAQHRVKSNATGSISFGGALRHVFSLGDLRRSKSRAEDEEASPVPPLPDKHILAAAPALQQVLYNDALAQQERLMWGAGSEDEHETDHDEHGESFHDDAGHQHQQDSSTNASVSTVIPITPLPDPEPQINIQNPSPEKSRRSTPGPMAIASSSSKVIQVNGSHNTPKSPVNYLDVPKPSYSYKYSFKESKMDPVLSALEEQSIINAKSKCAYCKKKGFNFPTCNKCKESFCSRDCRVKGAGNGVKHVCGWQGNQASTGES